MGLNDGSGILAYVGEEEAPIILKWLRERTGAASIIDLGTGMGYLVKAAEAAGIRCVGVEGNADLAAAKVCSADLLVQDVTSDDFDPGLFDLATSFECAEHIPMERMEKFFGAAAIASDRFICSIHTEGEEDASHVTLRSAEWWERWLRLHGIGVTTVHDFPVAKFNEWGSVVFDLDMTYYMVLS